MSIYLYHQSAILIHQFSNTVTMEPDKQILIEQYKLYVEMADRVTERRGKFNQYYLTLISGILGIAGYLFSQDQISTIKGYESWLVSAISILGILLSILWHNQILYCKRLNSAKFNVINSIEENFEVRGFSDEWKYYCNDKKPKLFTHNELWIPKILLVVFAALLLLSILRESGIIAL